MTIHFDYNKKQVIQALRYHFVSKREMRIMIILVNVFALLSLVLYLFGKISPLAFLGYSFLWIILMVSVWFILPMVVYNRAETFKHSFSMHFYNTEFVLEHEKGRRSWPYSSLTDFKETPYFFHLYFDSRSFLLVPKDAFERLEDMQELRTLLRLKIKS